MTFGPYVPSTGPKNAEIFLLADAPGDRESERGVPLVGPAGYELRRMLSIVGVDINETYRCNVFSRQPADNALGHYCTGDTSRQFRALGPLTNNPLGYMDTAHEGELARVRQELEEVRPNVIVALGNTASWALGLGLGIKALRGSVHTFGDLKVLPTYHPSAVLRDWSLRTITIADLEKAHHESHSPLLSFDNTELWLNPTLEDLAEFDATYMQPATVCACDIETKRGQITAISFSPRPDVSLCIPFWIDGGDPNYWGDGEAEALAWAYTRRWLERPELVKVFQNGLYDLQYITAPPYSITPKNCTEDTMLAAHSLWSELPKSLGFLGSIFANTPSWKNMRTWRVDEQFKRDE